MIDGKESVNIGQSWNGYQALEKKKCIYNILYQRKMLAKPRKQYGISVQLACFQLGLTNSLTEVTLLPSMRVTAAFQWGEDDGLTLLEQSLKSHSHFLPFQRLLLTCEAPPNPGRTRQRSMRGWGTLRAPVSMKLGLQNWATVARARINARLHSHLLGWGQHRINLKLEEKLRNSTSPSKQQKLLQWSTARAALCCV